MLKEPSSLYDTMVEWRQARLIALQSSTHTLDSPMDMPQIAGGAFCVIVLETPDLQLSVRYCVLLGYRHKVGGLRCFVVTAEFWKYSVVPK